MSLYDARMPSLKDKLMAQAEREREEREAKVLESVLKEEKVEIKNKKTKK